MQKKLNRLKEYRITKQLTNHAIKKIAVLIAVGQ